MTTINADEMAASPPPPLRPRSEAARVGVKKVGVEEMIYTPVQMIRLR
ncbi:MAG: hypothetical protein KY464_11480 [Gemmatimonadetes bacterium]|nr:hypothetical protein [Gemmatimonadota bacterium]